LLEAANREMWKSADASELTCLKEIVIKSEAQIESKPLDH